MPHVLARNPGSLTYSSFRTVTFKLSRDGPSVTLFKEPIMKRRTGLALLLSAALLMSFTFIGPKGLAERVRTAKESAPHSAYRAEPVPQQTRDEKQEISPAVIKALGLAQTQAPDTTQQRATSAQTTTLSPTGPGGSFAIKPGSVTSPKTKSGGFSASSSGLPAVLNPRSALSTALIADIGGANTQQSEAQLLADWDGREDMTSDRSAKIGEKIPPPPTEFFIRSAISEHTFANGHNFNSYYSADSVGNLLFQFDLVGDSLSDTIFPVNLPALVNTGTNAGFTINNPTPGDCADPQLTITGIAVNPVADLSDVDASLCGQVGEVIYVSTMESTGCAVNGVAEKIRTRIFAFHIFEVGGTEFIAPQVRQIARTSAPNLGGLAVDDDGSLYFSLADLASVNPATGLGGVGGAIFKATELPHTSCGHPGQINRYISDIPGLDGSVAATITQGPAAVANNGVKLTNYSGASSVFGNITSIAAGPGNAIYAATAASNLGTSSPTQGLFKAPGAFPNGLPSMIMTFADVAGGVSRCSSPTGGTDGTMPIGDGLADPAGPGTTVRWRAFVLGNGADVRTTTAPLASITGTPTNTLKLSMQIDFNIYSGITVNEEGTVFVVSGGTPGGALNNPSPSFSEILGFEDRQPADRRADYVDFRGDNPPVPPASGGNQGDGDSDRFDHIFYQAPNDPVTTSPMGISGLARGFLRYTNRLAPVAMSPGVTLGMTGGDTVLGDDSHAGPLFFDLFDPGHQVAGGDDQNTPFRGDDDGGAGGSPVVSPLDGGFEFFFGGPVGTAASVWNAFFINSNGSITFTDGDDDFSDTILEFREGLPKIAPAWADLNASARSSNPGNFPVLALGFSNVNAFKIRYINVTSFGNEECTAAEGGTANTFSATLYDDGTTIDENSDKPLNPANPIGNNAVPFDLQEGPTDRRFAPPPVNGAGPVFEFPRPAGSGFISFVYGRMDLIGSPDAPVLTGYSIGALDPLNPPGLCEENLTQLAVAADGSPFGVLPGGQTGGILPGIIGEGTEPTVFEYFNNGVSAHTENMGADVFQAKPDFDLRFEGNNPTDGTHPDQPDPNRERIDLFGIAGLPAAPPSIQQVIPLPVGFTPNAGTDLLDALGGVDVLIVGSGFYPNEVTTVCQNGVQPPAPGIPTTRAGKGVTTAITYAVDNNMDSIVDATIALTNITPVNKNLITARMAPLATAAGTAFPFSAFTGSGTITLTSTFSSGDNNTFGPYIRTAVGSLTPGTRAPIVLGVSQTTGDCSVVQNVSISGVNFNSPGPVTSVFAVEDGNPGNVIIATSFVLTSDNIITAQFNFGGPNFGNRFLIFVTGPGGTSRNLTGPAPAGVPPGNEQGNVIAFNCAVGVNVDTIQFSATNVDGTEGCAATNVTVSRVNPGSGTITVDYATSDGTATQKSDYEIASGTLTFAPGETSKVIPILINEDSFVEPNETINITLSNLSSGTLAGGGLSTVTIVDDDLVLGPNPIDDAATFVCQQYHDFLNREPDAGGAAFWTGEITSCGADPVCIEIKRQNVSAAFFLSTEFGETGFGVIRLQRTAFGKESESASTRMPYTQFMHDAQQIGRGVIIGQPGAEALLEANKQAYATQIVESSAFIARFSLSQTAAQYVAALAVSADVVLTVDETTAAVTAFGGGGTSGRVAALRSVADSDSVRAAEFNPAFVLLQYYGYLRRNPTDAPDVDDSGYQFWLTKLNSFGGNFEQADMVKAFLNSAEYRQRFGP